jgi:hypothetical protein
MATIHYFTFYFTFYFTITISTAPAGPSKPLHRSQIGSSNAASSSSELPPMDSGTLYSIKNPQPISQWYKVDNTIFGCLMMKGPVELPTDDAALGAPPPPTDDTASGAPPPPADANNTTFGTTHCPLMTQSLVHPCRPLIILPLAHPCHLLMTAFGTPHAPAGIIWVARAAAIRCVLGWTGWLTKLLGKTNLALQNLLYLWQTSKVK